MELNLKTIKLISIKEILNTINWVLNGSKKWEINFDHDFIRKEVTKGLYIYYITKKKALYDLLNIAKDYKISMRVLASEFNKKNIFITDMSRNYLISNIKINIINTKEYKWEDLMGNDLEVFKNACLVLFQSGYRFYEYLMGYFLCVGEYKKCMIGLRGLKMNLSGSGILKIAYTVIDKYPRSFSYAIAYYYGAYGIDFEEITFSITNNNNLISYIKCIENLINKSIIYDNVMFFDRPYLENELIYDIALINNEIKLTKKNKKDLISNLIKKKQENSAIILSKADLV